METLGVFINMHSIIATLIDIVLIGIYLKAEPAIKKLVSSKYWHKAKIPAALLVFVMLRITAALVGKWLLPCLILMSILEPCYLIYLFVLYVRYSSNDSD